jgi:hypothetical protein
VVDAIKQFNSDDYLNVHIDYPFIIDDNIINMVYFEITSTLQAELDIKQTLGLADLVIGGCEFDNIEYLEPIYTVNHEIMEKTTLTKTELNRVFDKYLFKIGNDYYKL